MPYGRGAFCVTGGAGFIGSHLVDRLLQLGMTVTVLDDMSNPNRAWLNAQRRRPRLDVVEGSCADPSAVDAALAGLADGQGAVYHLAANADIRGGADERDKDLRDTAVGTFQVLEGMKRHGIHDIVMTSTGAVYGERLQPPFSVLAGPLQPVSLYGAGKIAAEAFTHAYCAMFGLRAWIFRLGNVVGARMSRGAIRDFITKLTADPTRLEILGDGTQRKNYFLVEDCVEALTTLPDRIELTVERPSVVMNLGSESCTTITTITRCVIDELGLSDVSLHPLGGKRGWVGDQPFVELDVSEAFALGWKPSRSSDEAVREATRRMVAEMGASV
ncbi:SDR family NAD(P)-dependent oxidoreductase [Streptomyces sp. NPDC020747]|uniref:SDR family NAD(P)-dependent oxidoreductase n=1 Tax=Streptomyces sp. NPDC020747 TaxID=3365086 RepID=UPI0037911B4B